MTAISRTVIIMGLLVLVLASPAWSANYAGTWEFNLTLRYTTCTTALELATQEGFRLILEQDGRALTGFKDVDGVGEFYAGYTDTNGFSMTMTSSCPVVPDPTCTSDARSFSFERSKTAKKKIGSVVWTAVDRNDQNKARCVTVYTGKAWILPNKD